MKIMKIMMMMMVQDGAFLLHATASQLVAVVLELLLNGLTAMPASHSAEVTALLRGHLGGVA